jgi:hypothetical protein
MLQKEVYQTLVGKLGPMRFSGHKANDAREFATKLARRAKQSLSGLQPSFNQTVRFKAGGALTPQMLERAASVRSMRISFHDELAKDGCIYFVVKFEPIPQRG